MLIKKETTIQINIKKNKKYKNSYSMKEYVVL